MTADRDTKAVTFAATKAMAGTVRRHTIISDSVVVGQSVAFATARVMNLLLTSRVAKDTPSRLDSVITEEKSPLEAEDER